MDISDFSQRDKNLYFQSNIVQYVTSSGRYNTARILEWDNKGKVIVLTRRDQEVRIPEESIVWEGTTEPCLIPINNSTFVYVYHAGLRSRFKAVSDRNIRQLTFTTGASEPLAWSQGGTRALSRRSLHNYLSPSTDYGEEASRLSTDEESGHTEGRYYLLGRHYAVLHTYDGTYFVISHGVAIAQNSMKEAREFVEKRNGA